MFVNKRQKVPQPKRVESIPSQLRKNISKTSSHLDGTSSKNPDLIETQKESKKTLDWDDISLSSEESRTFERFLKRPEADPVTELEKKEPQNEEFPSKTSFQRPKTSRGASENIPKPQYSTSSALNRLADIQARIKNRQGVTTQNKVSLSGSDFDFDISSDSAVKRDIGKADLKLRETLKRPVVKRSTEKSRQGIFLTLSDSSDTSEEHSSSRKRFLKRDAADADDDVESQSDEERRSKGPSYAKNEKTRQEILKLQASTDLDESDFSLPPAHTISSNHVKDSKRSTSSKKVTFASDLVRSSDFEQSLDDIMPATEESEEPSSLDEVLPSKIHNILSLDDLLPSQEAKLDLEVADRPMSALGFVGLHSVDELMQAEPDVRSSSEYIQSMEEDIQLGSSNSEQSLSDGVGNALQNLRSLDDLQASDSIRELMLSPKPTKKSAKATNIFKAKETAVEQSESEEIRSESEKYTEDFHSDDDTLKDTESITQDVTEGSISASSVPEEDSKASKNDRDSYLSYSATPVSSRSSSTVTSRSPSPVRRKPKKNVESTEVQTDIAAGTWLPGSVYADTSSFKPSRLIDNEALDVLTSYNPANLAIQDLLRQQVTLTQEFVTRSKRLRDLAVSAIPCDYVYGAINEDGLARLKRIWHNDDSAVAPTT